MNRRIKRKLEKRDNIKNWRNYKATPKCVAFQCYYGSSSDIIFCGFKAMGGYFGDAEY